MWIQSLGREDALEEGMATEQVVLVRMNVADLDLSMDLLMLRWMDLSISHKYLRSNTFSIL